MKITNALELYLAAGGDNGPYSCDHIRNFSYNHEGEQQFANPVQFITMDKDGEVLTHAINPASLASGRSKEGDKLEIALIGGLWCSDVSVPTHYIGNVSQMDRFKAKLLTKNACFPIDETFTLDPIL